jgi:hypothetical protein
MHFRQLYDYDLNLLTEAAELLDKHLDALEEEAKGVTDPDAAGLYDRLEYVTGFGLVACQTYVNNVVGTLRMSEGAIERAKEVGRHLTEAELEESQRRRRERRDQCLVLGPHAKGHSIATIVNAAANYVKHHAEPELNQGTRAVLAGFDFWNAEGGVDGTAAYPIGSLFYDILHPQPPRFRSLLPLLKEWRDAVMACDKAGGWR